MPTEVPICYNMNIAGFANRINRFMQELIHSQSANTNDYNAHDVTRTQEYLSALSSFIDWVVGQPVLDLPKTTPQEIEIGEMTELQQVQNEMITDMVYYFQTLRDEALMAQSVRQSTGFMQQDEQRFRSVITAMTQYIENYVAAHNPMDMPESSPTEEMPTKKKK